MRKNRHIVVVEIVHSGVMIAKLRFPKRPVVDNIIEFDGEKYTVTGRKNIFREMKSNEPTHYDVQQICRCVVRKIGTGKD